VVFVVVLLVPAAMLPVVAALLAIVMVQSVSVVALTAVVGI
jgi:hypothetical protein